MESQSADAEPPPPPKPELRYPGLSRTDTEGQTNTINWIQKAYFCRFHCSKCINDFLCPQRAAFWLKLHLHHQCISTDQATPAQEETILPLHTRIRYICTSFVLRDVKMLSINACVQTSYGFCVVWSIFRTVIIKLNITVYFLHIISTYWTFDNFLSSYSSSLNIKNLFLSCSMKRLPTDVLVVDIPHLSIFLYG